MLNADHFSVEVKKEKGNVGEFILSPLPSGFGHTVGVSLRRTLLGSLAGVAVTQMKVKGVNHLFTTVKGVKEDLIRVMLAVKKIKFKYDGDEDSVKVKLKKTGKGKVKAGDLQVGPNLSVVNPDLELATLTSSKAKLEIELTVSKGVGYQSAEDYESSTLGVIGLDASFSPVKRVSFSVKPVRKGKTADWDQLTMEVETDGSIKPKKALEKSAEILTRVFKQILDPEDFEEEETSTKKGSRNKDLPLGEVKEIPLRLANSLKKGGYKNLGDLAEASDEELSKVRNVGGKSVELVDEVLEKYDLK